MTEQRKDSDASRAEWPAWMQRAQDGDQAAYNRLLKAMVPLIRKVVRRKIDDAILVEDVVQDTLLTIHRVRATYDPSRPILPWVSAIASSRAIDALRKRGRHRSREVHDDDALNTYADDAVPADDAGHAQDIRERLSHLPDRQREMVEMVHLREMSLNDAAKHSQLSIGAVKSLLHRALVRLRQTGADDHG
ncbi:MULTISPECIES: sigma-70 family RNA polymerase sigma factor [Asticcacaulis]|uniref:sigma-70 family RNA polymerase sigma factor n=1 Tax=Asticcacaulis TaxID=76890 RepID=UPI001AE64765|nr:MULTISPECIES: sigma-70 family RNA polymerase sigma factor [Asticcacaulis]MBP2158840.1 RNA polymerase sigma-70 factor (ECF subfamily) [Asticcacaulis solisilvae]MDR6799886.1 RNA polymerase sigma-70 factor (ECF subfamily) [Asticcacaulis sp. BE141]